MPSRTPWSCPLRSARLTVEGWTSSTAATSLTWRSVFVVPRRSVGIKRSLRHGAAADWPRIRRVPSPLASWYRRAELNAQAERVVAQAVLASADVEAPRHRNSYLPGDSAALRGLPAVCVRGGFGGAIRGTQPEREAMCRERD